jgi:release factor glutamine methyltransferase
MSASIISTLRAAGCVFAEDEARLLISSAGNAAELDIMLRQRVSGLPLEHIVGWAEFCGMRVHVGPGVFVPRRRTELLVREAVAVLVANATVIDIGCGSGAVGLALRSTVAIELYAVDIDPAAFECARRNLGSGVLLGDLYQPLPDQLRGHVDAIVANTPYVPTDAIRLMPAEARLHERRVALDGGTDGLEIARRVIAGAPSWLAPGGHLLMETSENQAPSVVDLMHHNGFVPRVSHCDDLSATVVIGRFLD